MKIFAFSDRSASSNEELGCRASAEPRRRMLGLFLRSVRSDDRLEQILGSTTKGVPKPRKQLAPTNQPPSFANGQPFHPRTRSLLHESADLSFPLSNSSTSE